MATEQEIIDCYRGALRGAIDDCRLLEILPAQGPSFVRMRERLKTVENCCRQLAVWRDGDARWLPIGIMMEMAHQKSRSWIVKHNKRDLFRRLADNLRMLEVAAHDLETRATGRTGSILPEPLALHRENRTVQVIGE